MILPYIYFGALFICAAGIVYLVVTDIVDRVHKREENILDYENSRNDT